MILIYIYIYTVRCRYNAVNFLSNPHKIHPIARPLGRGMVCDLWFDTLIYILLQSTQCGKRYRVIFDRVITTLDRIYVYICVCVYVCHLQIEPTQNAQVTMWFVIPCFQLVDFAIIMMILICKGDVESNLTKIGPFKLYTYLYVYHIYKAGSDFSLWINEISTDKEYVTWRLWCQKEESRACISSHIPQFTCYRYLVSATKILLSDSLTFRCQ